MTRTATLTQYRRSASERKLQDAVVEYAQWNGWECIQASDGAVGVAAAQGRFDVMPDVITDLVAIRERVVWCEFKTATGQLRPKQEALRDALLAAGAEWHLIRPDDWAEDGSGLVERIFA